jgi:hypothetical protein
MFSAREACGAPPVDAPKITRAVIFFAMRTLLRYFERQNLGAVSGERYKAASRALFR